MQTEPTAPVRENQSPPPGTAPAPQKKKRRLPVKRLIALAVIAGLGFAGWKFLSEGKKRAAASVGSQSYTTAAVERRDIVSSITGSSSLQAADSYSVTTLVSDTILTADFEEGDVVESGQILYTIDPSDAERSLEQAQISLEQAQRSYQKQLNSQADLTVTAPAAGQIITLNVEEGDEVNTGQALAVIRNSDSMTLELPFPAGESESIHEGDTAQVTLDSTFELLSGTVTHISAVTEVQAGNVQTRTVTIRVDNPGGLSEQLNATAAVGSITSTGSGSFQYSAEKQVTAQVSGTVVSLRAAKGDRVSKGSVIAVLESDSVTDGVQNASESVRNAQINLENRTSQLDSYTVTAPIQGTIIDKNYNAGEITESNKVLCTIYDLSYLTMTLSVDELDISNIKVGQTVNITADAVEDQSYTGVITKVSVAGTTSGGVTTYPVTIRIDETEGLLPGMNVDAEIVLEGATDVLAIPAGALNRGNTVLVTADSPSAANGTPVERTGENSDSDTPIYYSVTVTTGINDDDWIEITSGLQEGDTVAYLPTTSGNGFFMPGGMPGMGGMSGGMPSGGMPSGGMPSGGPGGGPGGGMSGRPG